MKERRKEDNHGSHYCGLPYAVEFRIFFGPLYIFGVEKLLGFWHPKENNREIYLVTFSLFICHSSLNSRVVKVCSVSFLLQLKF